MAPDPCRIALLSHRLRGAPDAFRGCPSAAPLTCHPVTTEPAARALRDALAWST